MEHKPGGYEGPCSDPGYLHDGRARSPLEAALLGHGGEAARVQRKLRGLSKDDRDALVDFWFTLKQRLVASLLGQRSDWRGVLTMQSESPESVARPTGVDLVAFPTRMTC